MTTSDDRSREQLIDELAEPTVLEALLAQRAAPGASAPHVHARVPVSAK